MQLRHARQSKEADLRRVFDKLDTKRDKKIDADELMVFFKQCGENFKKVSGTIISHQGQHLLRLAPLVRMQWIPTCGCASAVRGGRHDMGG